MKNVRSPRGDFLSQTVQLRDDAGPKLTAQMSGPCIVNVVAY